MTTAMPESLFSVRPAHAADDPGRTAHEQDRRTRSKGRLMERLAFLCCVVAGLSGSACSNSSPTPTPTAPTPTPTLAITPITNALAIGQTQIYTGANVDASVTVTWSSSDSSILTIDSAGTATAIANGTATITASGSDGQTATLQVQVVPNYQGTWTGNVTMLACTDLAGFASNNYCAQRLRTVQQLTLNLTQVGLAISGSVTKLEASGQVGGIVSGVIGSGGDITTLAGTLSGVVGGANLSVALISWNSLGTGANMTGSWASNVTSPQIVGIATEQWSFTAVK